MANGVKSAGNRGVGPGIREFIGFSSVSTRSRWPASLVKTDHGNPTAVSGVRLRVVRGRAHAVDESQLAAPSDVDRTGTYECTRQPAVPQPSSNVSKNILRFGSDPTGKSPAHDSPAPSRGTPPRRTRSAPCAPWSTHPPPCTPFPFTSKFRDRPLCSAPGIVRPLGTLPLQRWNPPPRLPSVQNQPPPPTP